MYHLAPCISSDCRFSDCTLEYPALLRVVLVSNQIVLLRSHSGAVLIVGNIYSSINHSVILDNIAFLFFIYHRFNKSQFIANKWFTVGFIINITYNNPIPHPPSNEATTPIFTPSPLPYLRFTFFTTECSRTKTYIVI